MLFSFAKIRFNLELEKKGGCKRNMKKENKVTVREKQQLILKKRRIPMAQPYIKGKNAHRYMGALNTYLFAYKYFETQFAVKAGDVYLARFPMEFGAELHGDHFVAVLLDSNQLNPLITVVPLKSEKIKELNPASDIRLGVIKGINSGHRTIAVINQIRAIDKRRLLSEEAINGLHAQFDKKLIKDYGEVCVEIINRYRLTPEQLKLLRSVTLGYIRNNYVKHDDEQLVDF